MSLTTIISERYIFLLSIAWRISWWINSTSINYNLSLKRSENIWFLHSTRENSLKSQKPFDTSTTKSIASRMIIENESRMNWKWLLNLSFDAWWILSIELNLRRDKIKEKKIRTILFIEQYEFNTKSLIRSNHI